MQPVWIEGQLLASINVETPEGRKIPVPVQIQFSNNGVMSVSVGDDVFTPSQKDLESIGAWTQAAAKGLGVPDDQVFVGAYMGRVRG